MFNKNSVFVLDTNQISCFLIHPGKARRLSSEGKATVFIKYPFTITVNNPNGSNGWSL